MASCTTPQWSSSTTPQCKLTVTIQSETATQVVLAWTLQYVTHGYTASTSAAKSYSAVIAGETVASGTASINGKSTFTIASGTKTITKTTASQTIVFSCSFGFNLTWSGTYGGTKSASGSIGVSAKTSYTVAYNANGGSGAPSSQTKWYGTNITLSSTKPTRTGYTFKGWATSSGGAVAYASGANYTANASVTLYAVWQAITYSVTYNANGGSGAPASQTKIYDVTLILSSTKPTRTNYNFKGWGTSAGASTVAYAAGASYTGNAALTLYAIWELAYTAPRITDYVVARCNSSGTASDEGTYAKVTFKWATDKAVSSITIKWKRADATAWSSTTVSASGTSGSVSKVIGSGAISGEYSYDIQVSVSDASGTSNATRTLDSFSFPIDVLYDGSGVAIGKAASVPNAFDVYKRTIIRDNIEINGNAYMKNGKALYGTNTSGDNRSLVQLTESNQYVFGYGSYSNNEGASYFDGNTVNIRSKGAIAITSPTAGLTARHYGVNKVLWSGARYMTADHTNTLSEAVSAQPNGVVLVFCPYVSGAAMTYDWNSFFVPKALILTSNYYHTFVLHSCNMTHIATKFLQLTNTSIIGEARNSSNGTGNGVTYDNDYWVLRYVYGV